MNLIQEYNPFFSLIKNWALFLFWAHAKPFSIQSTWISAEKQPISIALYPHALPLQSLSNAEQYEHMLAIVTVNRA